MTPTSPRRAPRPAPLSSSPAIRASLAVLAAAALAGACSDDGGSGPIASEDVAVDAVADSDAADVAEDTGSDAAVDAEPDVAADVLDEPPEFESFLRFVHLSADTPPVTVYLDGEPVFRSLEPFSVQPRAGSPEPYRVVPTRRYAAVIAPADGTIDDALVRETWALSPGGIYTVWLGGSSGITGAAPDDAEELAVFVAVDDTSVPELPDGTPLQRVRFFHAVLGAGPLDFWLDGEVVDEDLEFGWFSFDENVLPLGDFAFGFGPANAEERSFEVEMGFGNYTTNVWAGGRADEQEYWFATLAADNAFQVWEEVPPQFFAARFVNVGPALTGDADGLDVYVGSTAVGRVGAPPAATGSRSLESGRHRVAAFAPGADPVADTPAAALGARTYADDAVYTLVFFDGADGGAATRVEYAAEPDELADGRYFVNATGLAELSFADGTDATLAGPLAPGGVSPSIAVPAGTERLTAASGELRWSFDVGFDDAPSTVIAYRAGDALRLFVLGSDDASAVYDAIE